jgi:hypothetical protein
MSNTELLKEMLKSLIIEFISKITIKHVLMVTGPLLLF